MSPATLLSEPTETPLPPQHKITILKRSLSDLAFSQRKFLKKTRKGKVQKVLRERYLREDIPCGYEGCQDCSGFEGYKSVLPDVGYTGYFPADRRSAGAGRSTDKAAAAEAGAGHFLVIDTNIVLHQMDLLISLPPSIPLIIPSTVLSEVRHRSLPLYNRLDQLIVDEEKKVWVFWNEERKETATRMERVRKIDEEEVDGGGEMGEEEEVDLEDGGWVRESANDRNDRG